MLMLTSKSIVLPISFRLEKQTYNDVLIAIYYYASYFFFFMACGCLPELKVILWIIRTGIKTYSRLFQPCFYIVIEGATKITSLMTEQ